MHPFAEHPSPQQITQDDRTVVDMRRPTALRLLYGTALAGEFTVPRQKIAVGAGDRTGLCALSFQQINQRCGGIRKGPQHSHRDTLHGDAHLKSIARLLR